MCPMPSSHPTQSSLAGSDMLQLLVVLRGRANLAGLCAPARADLFRRVAGLWALALMALMTGCAEHIPGPTAFPPATAEATPLNWPPAWLQPTRLSAADMRSCVVDGSQHLRCWGTDTQTKLVSIATVQAADGSPVSGAVSVATGSNHACYVDKGGAVYCWGDSSSSAWTAGDGGAPGAVSGIGKATRVVVGSSVTCAIQVDGQLACWGANDYGQLGVGDTADHAGAVNVSGIKGVTAAATAYYFVCAVAQGKPWCWGINDSGQLGVGAGGGSHAPVQVPGIDNIVDISASSLTVCAVNRGGEVYCWGTLPSCSDASCQQSGPTRVLAQAAAVQVGVGSDFACMLTTSRQVLCWGRNDLGQLGDGRDLNRPVPAPVVEADSYAVLSDIVGLSVGEQHACALRKDDQVFCWGSNDYGQVYGRLATSYVQRLSETLTFARLRARDGRTCAQDLTGKTWCWGDNGAGALGLATGVPTYSSPTLVPLPDGADLGLAWGGGCIAESSGQLRCWGNQQFCFGGPCMPTAGGKIDGIGQITVGSNNACVLVNDGSVRCIGRNNYGQLGNGSTLDSSTFVTVQGGYQWKEIATLADTTCGVHDDGALACWGGNTYSNRIGTPGAADTNSQPISVFLPPGAPKFAHVYAGNDVFCALTDTGEPWCWGMPDSPLMWGGATVPDDGHAVELPALQFKTMAIGRNHACGVQDSGTVICWGNNDLGQLDGSGPTGSATGFANKQVFGAKSVAAGIAHSCALDKDSRVWCWGANDFGQSGGYNTARMPAAGQVSL